MDNIDIQKEQEIVEGKSSELNFIFLRIVFIALIAATILFTKYILPSSYEELKDLYEGYVSVNVSAEYFLGDENQQ